MNPIPVRVWSAAHDTALLPKTLDDAERITDDLLWGENEQPNPNYQAFAAEMLAWMQENEIPMLGALAALHSDLLRARQSKKVALYIEYFPRDHGELFHQFVSVARQHDLIVHDSAGPSLFLPDGNCMPVEANQNLDMLAHLYRKMQQYRKPTDIPTQMQQVPEWLQSQVNAYFSEYGFSDCVVQVDEDDAIMGKAWKKTPAGLMLLVVSVYERHGRLIISGGLSFFFRDFIRINKIIDKIDYQSKKGKVLAFNDDLTIHINEFKKSENSLSLFFEKIEDIMMGYIVAFTDIRSLYDYFIHSLNAEKVDRFSSYKFIPRATFILYPEKVVDAKNLVIHCAKIKQPYHEKFPEQIDEYIDGFEKQYALLQASRIPTLAENPSFYIDDIPDIDELENKILEGFQVLYT